MELFQKLAESVVCPSARRDPAAGGRSPPRNRAVLQSVRGHSDRGGDQRFRPEM